MHKEWCDALQKFKSVVIAAPRSHGKSSLISIGYTTWRVGLNPNIRIKIVVNKIELGKEILNAITNVLLFNPKYRLVFPHIRPAKTRYWTKERIYVERNKVLRDPTIEVTSVLATGAGGRSDLLICDDVCYDSETEVFTRWGWKKFKNVTKDDEVATLNPETQELEWQRPERVIWRKHKGVMYGYKSKTIDFLVTPGHQMFAYVGKSKWQAHTEEKCGELVPIEKIFLSSAPVYVPRLRDWRGCRAGGIAVPSFTWVQCSQRNWYKTEYDGYVGCVTVPKHHVILVKRGSSVYWCGNCDNRLTSTPGLMRKVRNAFYDVWMNTLEPKENQVVVIGTIWAEGDIMTELLANPSFEFRKLYAIDHNFTPLWPQVWTREKLYERWKQNPVAFDRGFRNKPVSPVNAIFPSLEMDPTWKLGTTLDPPDIFALKESDPSVVRYFTGVDLSTKAKSADYSVVFTIGVNRNTRVRWPVDIRRIKASSPDVARVIIEVYEKFSPEVIMVESNAYQHALIDWVSEIRKLPLRAYYTGTQKHGWDVGIRSLRIELDNKLWVIPYWDHSVECDCAWCAWKKEVLSYPWGLHDDTVIAWWLAREAYRLVGEKGGAGYTVFTW